MSLVGHKARNGNRRMNKHDDLCASLVVPNRGVTIGKTADMLVFQNYNKSVNRARNEVAGIMAKNNKPVQKVRKVRDRGGDDEHPTTIGGLVNSLAKRTPNLVKDSILPAPSRVRMLRVPNKPLPGQAPTIWAAKKEGEVELHLLRGVTDSREMAQIIKLPERKAREFMERVRARWAITGSAYDVKQARGEAKAYLGKMKLALWDIVESRSYVDHDGKKKKGTHEGGFVNKSETRVYSMSLLTRLFGTQLMLDGVTQDAIEDLSRAADDSGEVMQRMTKQRSLSDIAGRLLDIVQGIREAKAAGAHTIDAEEANNEEEEDEDDGE